MIGLQDVLLRPVAADVCKGVVGHDGGALRHRHGIVARIGFRSLGGEGHILRRREPEGQPQHGGLLPGQVAAHPGQRYLARGLFVDAGRAAGQEYLGVLQGGSLRVVGHGNAAVGQPFRCLQIHSCLDLTVPKHC